MTFLPDKNLSLKFGTGWDQPLQVQFFLSRFVQEKAVKCNETKNYCKIHTKKNLKNDILTRRKLVFTGWNRIGLVPFCPI